MYNRSNQRINYFSYLRRDKFQSSGSPYYFAYGRTALKAGLSAYDVPSGKKILVPNYICAEAVAPFIEYGIAVTYYAVKEDLSPDWNSVVKGLSPDTFGIMMVHYFGIPQDIKQFIQFATQNNLLLIEDNSHGFAGSYDNRLLGTFGDIGIASPRKSLPILNGGILFLKEEKKLVEANYSLEPQHLTRSLLKDFIGRILDHFPTLKRIILEKKEIELPREEHVNDSAIDSVSYNHIKQTDVQMVCKKRTEIFNLWAEGCLEKGLTPLYDLTGNSIAPLCMPLLFNSKNERDRWFNLFKKHNVAVFIWPVLPAEVATSNNSGVNLRDRILCLPIHFEINPVTLKEFLTVEFSSE